MSQYRDKQREENFRELKVLVKNFTHGQSKGSISQMMATAAVNYQQYLEVAEMFRDQVKKSDLDMFNQLNTAIRNYYRVNPCPHRLKVIKPLTSACGCETTVVVCQDCDTMLSTPKTDC